jgi:hypothetical protein
VWYKNKVRNVFLLFVSVVFMGIVTGLPGCVNDAGLKGDEKMSNEYTSREVSSAMHRKTAIATFAMG